ncbi:MAG: sulfatase-like hydrolase/transferase [Flavobacteriales bacterium]|nr:sulfatase-like hydrolase/transferase [Flavobacteriales bacterium]
MKHFNTLRLWMTHQKNIYWTLVVILCVPNIFLFFTEDISLLTRVPFILVPLSIYMMMVVCRRPGWSMILFFVMMVLGAFQLVLLYLFGRSIIASDMFLNLFTTNVGEAEELLGKLLPAIVGVVVLYSFAIAVSVQSIYLKEKLTRSFRLKMMKISSGLIVVSIPFMIAGKTVVQDDIFPINIFYNMGFAYHCHIKSNEYQKTSAGFSFGALSEVSDSIPEVYVLVVGETARADHFSLFGYQRKTTPFLDTAKGVVPFADALTQTNATHKSVPIILSGASASDFENIYCQKSILSAFSQSGFYTVFISNQKPNGSFTEDYFCQADKYIDVTTEASTYDKNILPHLKKILSQGHKKLFVVVHTYGSHFNYSQRYPKENAYYKPDDVEVVSYREKDKLINAFDNTIRYTDEFLGQIISTLDSIGVSSAMFYCTDHGEDLIDDSRHRFLHASPVPTYYQLHIPYLWWFSSQYKEHFPEKVQNVISHKNMPVSTANVFHTMCGVANIKTQYADTHSDISSDAFKVQKRYFLNDHNQKVALDSLGLKKLDIQMIKSRGITYP